MDTKRKLAEDERMFRRPKKAKNELDVLKNEHDLAKGELRSLEAALHRLQDELKIFQKELLPLEKQLLDSQLNKDETKILILHQHVADKKVEIAKKESEIADKKVEMASKSLELGRSKKVKPDEEKELKQMLEFAIQALNKCLNPPIQHEASKQNEPVPLRNDPPTIEELDAIELPALELPQVDESVFPPLGPDGEPDLRFLPVTRPTAEKFADKLEKLGYLKIYQEMWIAMSGSGKTSAIFQVARRYYTVYIPCIPRLVVDANNPARREREKSGTFCFLDDAIKTFVGLLKDGSREKTDEAKRVSAAFIVSHFFILLRFLTKYTTATPIQFLFFQLVKTTGQQCIEKIFQRLRNLTLDASKSLAESIRQWLDAWFKKNNIMPTMLLAVDEIEGAATAGNDYLSRNDHPNRGLLSPFLQAVGDLQRPLAYSLVVCGTGSSYERADTVVSDIGKGAIQTIPEFPLATKQDVYSLLKKLPGVNDDCINKLSRKIVYLMNARFRLLSRTVEEFYQHFSTDDVSLRLSQALDASIAAHKESLFNNLNRYINSPDKSDRQDISTLLHRVYIASKLSNGRMPFTTNKMDLCRIGLGANLEKNVYRVSEKFALEVIEDLFSKYPDIEMKIKFQQSVDDLNTVVLARGPTTSTKGDLFENVVFNNLLRKCLQDKPVTQLPFVHRLENPESEQAKNKVWNNVKFKCSNIVQNAPEGQSTPKFVKSNLNTILSPETAHRTDGIALLDEQHILMIGSKLYTNNISADIVESQFRSTNPAKVYGRAAIDSLNEKFQNVRNEWDQLGLDRLKALRIHINIPKSVIPREDAFDEIYRPGTFFIQQDESLVVNIDMSNIGQFFYSECSNSDEERIIQAILRLLNYLN